MLMNRGGCADFLRRQQYLRLSDYENYYKGTDLLTQIALGYEFDRQLE